MSKHIDKNFLYNLPSGAVVHPCRLIHKDGTLRPQLISQSKTPALHMLLRHYRSLTGVPALINTSLNIHEEPIVRSAEEAIMAAKRAKISILQVGKYSICL